VRDWKTASELLFRGGRGSQRLAAGPGPPRRQPQGAAVLRGGRGSQHLAGILRGLDGAGSSRPSGRPLLCASAQLWPD